MSLRQMLPRVMLIGDRFTDETVAHRILEAARGGIHWIQLRDHDADTESFYTHAKRLVDSLRAIQPDILISINSRLAVAEKLNCAVHLRVCGPREDAAHMLIPEGLPVGLSVHTRHEIEDTHSDYLILSPIYDSKSKPGQAGIGLDILRIACNMAIPIPVIAMGGITPDRVKACLSAGAFGVAVLSGILDADDIPATIRAYKEAFQPSEVGNV